MHYRLAYILVIVSFGCGDDRVSSETLDELGQSGYDLLCDEARDRLREMYASSLVTRFICTAQAVESTSNAADCAAAVDECLSNPPESAIELSEQILGQAGCSAVSLDPSGCDEPVTRLTTCLDDLESEIDRVEFTATCAAAGEPVDADWWHISVPSSCTSVEADCS